MELLLQFLGLFLLLAGMWLGYRQWIRPHEATLTPNGRGLLILLLATLMGGFIGSPFWWTDQPLSFSWDLPPLASRMLGAAGWSFFAVTLLALRHPSHRRVRLLLWLLLVYLAPLAAVIIFVHLDRFDFSAPITYGFFAVAVPMTLATLWYLIRQPRIIADESRDALPANRVVQVWLPVVAVITGLWGMALFVTDTGPSSLIWAWPGDLLSSRLIAVMLLTIATGALYSFRHADTANMMLAMIIIYSLGITVASVWNALYALPIKPFYAAVFGAIFLVSTILLISDRSPRPLLTGTTP